MESKLDFRLARIDQQVFLLRYSEHYARVLEDVEDPDVLLTQRRIAELFLFRAWTTQFGYGIFSLDRAASEKLIGETVNSCKYLGLAEFEKLNGFSVEDELGGEFIDLIEDRWRTYDEAVIAHRGKENKLPTLAIIGSVVDRLKIAHPLVTFNLSRDFIAQLEFIKKTAFEIGLLSE